MKADQMLSHLYLAWRRMKENKVQLTVLSVLVAVGLVSSLTSALTGDRRIGMGYYSMSELR